jgi:transcriptional regulator with XRE-family HTH domain
VNTARVSLSEHVGREIRAELARQHKSQTWLAEALDVYRPGLNRRLCGHLPFDIDLIERIASVLGVPVDQFFQGRAA